MESQYSNNYQPLLPQPLCFTNTYQQDYNMNPTFSSPSCSTIHCNNPTIIYYSGNNGTTTINHYDMQQQQQQQTNNIMLYSQQQEQYYQQQPDMISFFNELALSSASTFDRHQDIQQQQQQYNPVDLSSSYNYYPIVDQKHADIPLSPLPSIQSNLSSPNMVDDQFSTTMSIASSSSSQMNDTLEGSAYFGNCNGHHHHHHSYEPLVYPLSPPSSPSPSIPMKQQLYHKIVMSQKSKKLITKKEKNIKKNQYSSSQQMKSFLFHGATLKQQQGVKDVNNEEDEDDQQGMKTMVQQQPEKEYVCQYKGCGKSFGRKYNLNSHEKCHSSVKDYRCNVCGREFLRQHDLKRHQRIHTKETPHHCIYCSKGFGRADALQRHYSITKECELLLQQDPSNPLHEKRLKKKKAQPTGYGEKKRINN